MSRKQDLTALSRHELNEVIDWYGREAAIIEEPIRGHFKRLIAVYSSLGLAKSKATQTLTQLRQAMGILPRSERGRQDSKKPISGEAPPPSGAPDAAALEQMDPETRARYEALKNKRSEARRQSAQYDREIRAIRGSIKSIGPQLEFDLEKPNEMLFSFPLAERKEAKPDRKVDRMKEFGKTQGMHSSKDRPKRMDLRVIATEFIYNVETVTDPETGKSVRASTIEDGPPFFQLTWTAIANLIKMHVGFAIPIHRIVLMIGQPEFSSSKICRVLRFMAENLLEVYLCLGEQLSDARLLSGDDTPTKVLSGLSPQKPDPLVSTIDERLGWVQPRASGKGEKKQLHVSLIVGKTEDDPRSTIRFFRTHVGSVGNLLTKILESRSPRSGAVIFQGDLSSSNLPSPEIRQKIGLKLAGCGAHARRPFWRHRSEDESLCYFMLRGFLMLSKLEHRIDALGRTRQITLRLRSRYGRMIWNALRNRCIAATTGEIPGPATYPQGIRPDVWPPDHELHVAARYVIRHFEELTLYLTHPDLEYTNNGRERALRIEKLMLLNSKFRKTKLGRMVLDILRTINATCTAANVDLTGYLCYVFKHQSEIHDHPEDFTPFAYAKLLDREKQQATVSVNTVSSN